MDKATELALKKLGERIALIEKYIYACMLAEKKLREDNLKQVWNKYHRGAK